MNRSTYLRMFTILACIAIVVVGLTSCKLPASKGPQTTSDGSHAGSEATGSGANVPSSATQTAQALPSYITVTPVGPQTTSQNPAIPTTTVPAPPVAPAPTETQVEYVVATAGAPPATYTLTQGEYPFCIARRFNVDINELLSINGLSSSSYTYAGQVLKLPQTGNPFVGERALKPHPDYYQIKSGDTLNTIACSYGDVSPDMIALQNGLTEGNYAPGDVIIIP